MRVCFFVNNYAPSVGGVQEHIGRVAQGLIERHGFDVEVLTSDALRAPGGVDAGRVAIRDEIVGGVAVHRRPVARRTHSALRNLRRVGRRLGVYRSGRTTLLITGPLGMQLARSSRELADRSDVVVGVAAPSASLFGSDLATRRSSTKFVAMPLLHLGTEPPRPWVMRSIRRADAISANSAYERDWLVSAGVSPDRITVLSPGVDPAAYPQREPSEARAALGLPDRVTVGFVGRMAAYKGVDVLVAAMRRVWVEYPDAQLLLAGAASGFDVHAEVERLEPKERARVILFGEFPDGERAELLSSCDVVAHPSSSESFGMVTIEAWCADRPVVAGDIPAVRSLIRPDRDGELVPVGDPDALAAVLLRLLGDRALRNRLADEGHRRSVEEFAWTTVVARWAQLLESLMTGNAPATGNRR